MSTTTVSGTSLREGDRADGPTWSVLLRDEVGSGATTLETVGTTPVGTAVSTGPAVCKGSSTGGCRTWTSLSTCLSLHRTLSPLRPSPSLHLSVPFCPSLPVTECVGLPLPLSVSSSFSLSFCLSLNLRLCVSVSPSLSPSLCVLSLSLWVSFLCSLGPSSPLSVPLFLGLNPLQRGLGS